MDKPIPEAVLEAVARAICVACEENPDHQGDARGNEFRWQDYRDTALAAISALTAAQKPDHIVDATKMVAQQQQGQGQAVAWVSRHDAMFSDAGNWRYKNPVLCSSQESPDLIPLYTAPPSAPVGVAEAWQQGYHQGILDERISEANIGIAGFNAKVEPARINPYLAQQPAAAWQAIVEACVITEAVVPDEGDVRGTLDRLIDYHVGINREQQHAAVDRRHPYVQSKYHGGCANCGYPEWEPWHALAAQPGGSANG